MGRAAAGVRGVRLTGDDRGVGIARADEGYLLTVTENGYGKLTPVEEFSERHRGGQGVTAHNLTDKTGPLVGIQVVETEDDLMLMTSSGVIIRTPADSVRVCGRASQGVILMRLDDGVKVIDVEKTARGDEEETSKDASAEAPAEAEAPPAPTEE